MYNRDIHHCKHCKNDFAVKIDQAECGDLLLVCPVCGWPHPRRFVDGVAVSCDVDYNNARRVLAADSARENT